MSATKWDCCMDIRIARTDGKGGVVFSLNGCDAPEGIDLFHGSYVDTLRAQLEAAEAEWREKFEARTIDWSEASNALYVWRHRAKDAEARAEAAEAECARFDSEIDAAFDAAAADLEQNLAEHGETHINGAYYGLCLMRMEIRKARTKEQQA